MTEKTCRTCIHGRDRFMPSWNPPKHDLRCFRTRMIRGGDPQEHLGVGASCRFETDSIPEPHRVALDKCGPERIHWEAA